MGNLHFEAGEYEFENGDVVSYPAGDYVYDGDEDEWYLVEDGELYELDEEDVGSDENNEED